MYKNQSRNKNKEGNRRRKRGINDSKGMAMKRGVEIDGYMIYVNNDLETKIEDRGKDRGKRGKGKSINYYLEGNFNVKIRREGGRVKGENMEDMERRSKDTKMNKEGRKLCGRTESVGT